MPVFIHLFLFILLSTCSFSAIAAPCDARDLPKPIYDKIEKEEFSDAEKLALEAVKAAPDEQTPQVNLAKVYINAALRPAINIDFKALGIDPDKTGTLQEFDMGKLKKATSDDFAVDQEYAEKAEKQINKIYNRWPAKRSLLYCLTKIDFYSRDHGKFLKSLHHNAEAFADSEEEAVGYFLSYGQKYFKQNDPKKTADVYETLLKTFPKNAPLTSSLGVTYLQRGRTAKAAELFDNAYKLAPKDEIIVGNIAELSMLTGQFDKAERFLKIKAEMQPENTSIYFDLAMNAMHKGPKNSLPYWEAYFKQNKKHPDDRSWSDAAAVIQKAIQDGLDEADQLDLAGQFIEGMRAPKYAIPMMAYLKEKNKSDAAFPYRMGHAYDRGEHYDLAEKALLEAYNRLEKTPSKYMDLSSNEILYNLARMAYGQKKYKDSLNYLDKMNKNEQEKANSGYMYGLTYLGLGNQAEAKKAFNLCKKSSESENLRKLCEQQVKSF